MKSNSSRGLNLVKKGAGARGGPVMSPVNTNQGANNKPRPLSSKWKECTCPCHNTKGACMECIFRAVQGLEK